MSDGSSMPIDEGVVRSSEINTPRGEPLFKVNEAFVRDKLPSSEADHVIQRQLSPYEMAYTLGDYSYIVWKIGPKAGSVYHVVPKPEESQVTNLPAVEDIKTRINQYLVDLESFIVDHRASHGDDEWNSRNTYSWDGDILKGNVIREKSMEVVSYLYRLYYGDANTVGLEQAQLFDLDGKGEGYYRFLSDILPRTEDEAKEVSSKYGYKNFLRNIAIEQDLSNVAQINWELDSEFFGYSPGRRDYYDSNNPIILQHSAYGFVFPTVLHLGGLASGDYSNKQGIKRLFGGEMGTGGNYSMDVSFFYYYNGRVPLGRGFGRNQGLFSYPIAFGIDQERAKRLSAHYGSFRNAGNSFELAVDNFVSLNDISHIFVPPFKVDEITTLLHEHGFNHIKVVPFNTPSGDNVGQERSLPTFPKEFDESVLSAANELKERLVEAGLPGDPLGMRGLFERFYEGLYGHKIPTDPDSLVHWTDLIKQAHKDY